MDLTAEEMLLATIKAYNKKVNDMSKFAFSKHELELFTGMMDNYAEQKWKQGCKLQIDACSDKVFYLQNEDADAETWHEKVKKTKLVKYDNEPEYD